MTTNSQAGSGISSDTPLTYDPPASDPAELQLVTEEVPEVRPARRRTSHIATGGSRVAFVAFGVDCLAAVAARPDGADVHDDVNGLEPPSHTGPVPRRPGRAWLAVTGCAVALTVAAGPLVLSTAGVFIKPISEEFGWDRGSISSGVLVGGLLSAVSLPLVGLLIDRWGVRRVLPIGIGLLALNLAAIAVTPPVLGVYILLIGLTGLTGATQNPVGYVKTVARWFDRKRGLALGVAVAGLAVGQALVPQYTQFLVGEFGWRTAYVGLAALLLVVALPAVLGLVRDPATTSPPLALDRSRAGSVPRAMPGLPVRAAVRGRSFWLLVASIVLVAATIQGSLLHVVPLLTDMGWSPPAAAATLAAAGAASLVGRIGGGFLYDRAHAPYVGAGIFLLAAIGLLLLATGTAPVAGIMAIGLAAGAETDLIGYLASRYFGLAAYGQLTGWLFAAFGIGSAVGPFVLGVAFDANGSYSMMLVVFAVVLAVAGVVLAGLPKPYPFPPEPHPTGPAAQASEPAAEPV